MRIGIPREIKSGENRVAATPAGVKAFVKAGHEVFVEKDAGLGSMISNEEYTEAGATILPAAAEVWARSELILKIKEFMPKWIRTMRIQRDIPSTLVQSGVKKSNLGQMVEEELKNRKI